MGFLLLLLFSLGFRQVFLPSRPYFKVRVSLAVLLSTETSLKRSTDSGASPGSASGGERGVVKITSSSGVLKNILLATCWSRFAQQARNTLQNPARHP